MIPANELRIWNFVMFTTEQKDYVIEVRNIYSDGINGSYNNLSEDEDIEATFEDIEPIPLMPELLEKCGFKKTRIGYDGYGRINLYVSPSGVINVSWGEWVVGEPIKSLHQFQNIYFALAGTELKINL